MYEIYSVIGVILIITGLISSGYFTLHTEGSKGRKRYIDQLIDGLGALFLGIFYIYSYVQLKESIRFPSSTLTFQEDTYLNVSEEPLIFNFLPTSTSNKYPSSTDTASEGYDSSQIDNDSKLPVTTETFSVHSSTPASNSNEEITMIPLVDNLKNDSFSFYQNFFKDIIQKNTEDNSKLKNRTIFYNNKQYGRNMRNDSKRIKRETQRYVHPNKKCFKRNFLKHSLLICSFLYSVICLINTTKFCYEHKVNNNRIESEEEIKEDSIESSQTSETSQNSLFVKKNEKLNNTEDGTSIENPVEKSEPNLDIFLAKSIKTTKHKDENIKIQSDIETRSLWTSKNVPYILKLIMIWFSPALCIFILHAVMDGENLHDTSTNLDFAYNFTHTKVDTDLLKLINNPPNTITQEKTKEIDDIIQNVYKIMGGVSKQPETKNNLNSDIIYDIIHHLNRKYEKHDEIHCFFNTPAMKIHSFILFCMVNIGSIFYCRVLQMKMKFQENKMFTNTSTLYVASFTLIWLPCIVELFFRMYIFDRNPSAASDATLALANLFIVFNNFFNYLLNKKMRKICETAKI